VEAQRDDTVVLLITALSPKAGEHEAEQTLKGVALQDLRLVLNLSAQQAGIVGNNRPLVLQLLELGRNVDRPRQRRNQVTWGQLGVSV
jgi:hypothetical protein